MTTPLTRFGFLTLRNFSMIAFTNAIEPLRMANYLAREDIYRWSVHSLDGVPVEASNGLTVAPTSRIEDSPALDILFVCGGIDVPHAVDERLIQLLRRLARERMNLGALCTGAYALARAGLLDGYRCAIHWENLWGLRETFPRIVFAPDLFVIDRDRCTCTGGIAPLDMILHLITPRIGRTLAAGISEQFILERIRDSKDRQRIPIAARLGGCHTSITQAAALMEANIEEPLALDRGVAAAAAAALSPQPRSHPRAVLRHPAPAPRSGAPAADRDADHEHRGRLRFSLARALQQILPRRLRSPSEPGAASAG